MQIFSTQGIPFGTIAIIIAGLVFLAIIKNLLGKQRLSYYQAEFLSPAEMLFFRNLEEVLPLGYRAFAKVRIADVLMPQKSLSKENWNRHFWKVSSKHFDYVVCDEKTLKPVFAIELNDKSHQRGDRSTRDQLVDEVCKSAGFPIMWVQAKGKYNFEALYGQISSAIFQAEEPKSRTSRK